ncbi:MAG: RNA polymerase sigma-54 factor [Betaproteobacteria bacterium ADurb.Bin341]|nr:MAG: RNA polymerase sigma-54 factor [Betaproteobacteria bacterium ADurb.Bin341]
MKPALQLKLSQQLAMTPQLQQAIKLLQLSTVEMQQELERYLLENPMLEREDDEDAERGRLSAAPRDDEEYSAASEGAPGGDEGVAEAPELPAFDEDDRWSADAGTYSGGGRDEEGDEMDAQDLHAAHHSLRDHLEWQLGMTTLSERDRTLVHYLIDALDENGYLAMPLEELLEALPDELGVEPEDLDIALRHLQHFDPAGVGARSPRECLDLQLQTMPKDPRCALARQIVSSHLELLAARDYSKIMRLTACGEDDLRAAQALITSLDPHPGARFAVVETRYIIPDVIVKKLRGKWTAYINPDAFPRLRVNRLYAEILSRQRRGNGNLSGQLQEARWLIKNVQQRFETILRVAEVIVERQRQFFEHGAVAMRPMVLREVAEVLGLHESTISRVTSQKYMATPRGIFELKYFFCSHVATDSGGACAATAIRCLIKQLIAAEDHKNPLSDSQISEILGQQGIVVARRTVAKYREMQGIPPVKLRKSL